MALDFSKAVDEANVLQGLKELVANGTIADLSSLTVSALTECIQAT